MLTVWIEIIGFLAAGATVAAFSCKQMVYLRIAAIAANCLFIFYAVTLALTPIWVLHCILLPLNGLRLMRCLEEYRVK
jgi:hypothetical protein